MRAASAHRADRSGQGQDRPAAHRTRVRRVQCVDESVALLAEAVFPHIDEIAAASVQAYADAQADAAGTADRRRHRLLILLVTGGLDADTLRRAAAEADWQGVHPQTARRRLHQVHRLFGALPADPTPGSRPRQPCEPPPAARWTGHPADRGRARTNAARSGQSRPGSRRTTAGGSGATTNMTGAGPD
ncbi:hypothetical protein ACWCPJ_02840 [Streptomyces collinus]